VNNAFSNQSFVPWSCFFIPFFSVPKPPGTQAYIRKKMAREGLEKVIKCVATASHKPDVNWYRKGKKLDTTKCTHPNDVSCQDIVYEVYEERKPQALQSTRARTIQVLKIRSALYPRDQGKFECIATNGHARPATLIVDLEVQGIYNVTVVKDCLNLLKTKSASLLEFTPHFQIKESISISKQFNIISKSLYRGSVCFSRGTALKFKS